MKTIILSALWMCVVLGSLHAQDRGRDKIKALKVAYITENLELSSEEAQNFWPVYNAYEEKMEQYRIQKFGKIKQSLRDENIKDISEADAKKMLAQMEDIEEGIYTARKQLLKDLQNVISAKKILLLKKAEDDFNRQLLSKLKERREKRFNKN